MKNKKVALIGNMNNNFFVLQRYLLDNKIDCDLFILPYEPNHFLPINDTWDEQIFKKHYFLKWGNVELFTSTTKQDILNTFKEYTNFIACGTSMAYLNKAKIRVDLFIPYGSDLYELPFKIPRRPNRLIKRWIFNYHQKKGIKNAKYCSIADVSELLLDKLKRIKFSGKLLDSGVPMVYSSAMDVNNKSKHYKEFLRIRNSFDLVIFHQSRHVWKTDNDLVAVKSNDKLIRAISKFKQKNNNISIALITTEYGVDVIHSKKLIKDSGIDENVFWFPTMARKELMVGISLSDLVAGEFNNSWFTYGVVFEAMAMGKPIIHHRNDSIYKNFILYPMIEAFSENDIYKKLTYYSLHKDELNKIGSEAKDWYTNYFVEKSIREILNIIEKC